MRPMPNFNVVLPPLTLVGAQSAANLDYRQWVLDQRLLNSDEGRAQAVLQRITEREILEGSLVNADWIF